MVAQLGVSLLLVLVIIFVPYFIGLFIPVVEDFVPNKIGKWLFGIMVLALLVVGVGTLILLGKGLWIASGHLLGKF